VQTVTVTARTQVKLQSLQVHFETSKGAKSRFEEDVRLHAVSQQQLGPCEFAVPFALGGEKEAPQFQSM